ncbi:allantoate permease [Trichomonascus vanleenenianus]|uniref:allantoate permease family MFS transporter n=1 Tax=Trichomonascus vanleenenianus TaxID=2268995 RepID=UPI003ECAC510
MTTETVVAVEPPSQKNDPDVEIGLVDNMEEKRIQSKNDIDEAYEIAQQSQGLEIDEETNKRLLRKIDLYICPLMCFVYAVQYMDKTSNSAASIMGLRTDLKMEGSMYSWTGTGFYLGYMVFEMPFSFILQRYSLSKMTALFIVLWGAIMMISAAPNSYAGFETLRVLLGALESAITPAFVIITSQWYKREEQFMRTSMWFCCNGLGTILGGAISYGLYKREVTVGTPIAAWRILFITIGLLTIVLGVVCYFHIPDNPSKAWFLTPKERLLVVERIRSNKQGFGNKHFKKSQFIEAFTDVRTYIFIVIMLGQTIPNGGLSNFTAIIISSLGYVNERALLMTMPCGAVEIVGLLLGGVFVQYTQKRMVAGILGSLVFQILGTCLLAFPKSSGAQLAGLYLYNASPITFVCLLSCITSNTAGHTKKITVNAIFLIFYGVGNLIGPQTFIATQAPHYTGAKICMVVCAVICAIFMCILYYVNWRANKIRDERNETLDIDNSEFADLTDFENPEFRYAL